MINTTLRSKTALNRDSLSSINQIKVQGALSAGTIDSLNRAASAAGPPPRTQTASAAPQHTRAAATPPRTQAAPARTAPQPAAPQRTQTAPVPPHTQAAPAAMRIPPLIKPVQKGQKVPLAAGTPPTFLKACFGWNTVNAQCDVDVSAFLLSADGKVPGDSWFVFYGQPASPDQSCVFQPAQAADRQMITVDFQKLNPAVKKIVFVLTINEAFEKRLHFGMMKDAYVRILQKDGTELTSFKMTDYYSNVISMMIGEIYQYNGSWKFSAVGNGVSRDLAGLCDYYGVQVSD